MSFHSPNKNSDDLFANRAGFISRRQRLRLGLEVFGHLTVAFALLIFVLFAPSSSAFHLFRIIIAILGIAFACESISICLDLLNNRVSVASGRFQKSRQRTPKGFYHHWLIQNHLKLDISEAHYKEFDEHRNYRVFYLPNTKRVLSYHTSPILGKKDLATASNADISSRT